MNSTRRAAFLATSFSIGVFSAFNNFTLTLWLAGFTTSYLLLGLLGNTKSFEGTIVSPIAGVWSDRTWAGWLGRRRPFILAGGLLSALLLALTPAISRLPTPEAFAGLPAELYRLVPAIVAIFLFTLTFNMMDDIHKALLVDITRPSQRNRLSALRVVTEMAGQVGILVLGFFIWREGIPDSAFVITGALMAAGVLITVAGVREPEPAVWVTRRDAIEDDPDEAAGPDRSRSATGGELAPAGESALTPRTLLSHYRGAAIFCLVAFAYWSGVNAVMPLVSVYVRDILGANEGEAQLLPGLLLLSTTVLAIPFGRLGDRFGKRRMISAGYAVMGCAALAGLVITTKEQGAVVFLLAGVGNAASLVLTIPLLADLVPRRHVGAATGILAASGSVAAPLASLVAGALSDAFGPRAIFALMAATIAVALVLLPFVRSPAETDRPAAAPLPALDS